MIQLKKFMDGFKVSNIGIKSSLRGNGYGFKLYLAISNFLKVPLYSGHT